MGLRLTLGFLDTLRIKDEPYFIYDRIKLDVEDPDVLDRILVRGTTIGHPISWAFDSGREIVYKNNHGEPLCWMHAHDLALAIRGDLTDKDAGVVALLLQLRAACQVVLWWD